MNREEAIEILIAVAVCDRPILSCDFCARCVGMGTDCTYPSDKEIEESVLLLKGASNDAAISVIRQQDQSPGSGKMMQREPMTNADRIRAMSDEELAEFIKKIKVRSAFCKAVKNNDAFKELCSEEWLQQPAEEDKHENLDR